jgi:hypothetical protein
MKLQHRCIGELAKCERLLRDLDLDANRWKVADLLELLNRFNRVHGFGLHPSHHPVSGMNRHRFAWSISNTIGGVITNMGGLPTGVPLEKEARPPVMVHRFRVARCRNGYLQHAHQRIFKNDSMAFWRGLNGVVTLWKTWLVLCTRENCNRGQPHQESGAESNGNPDSIAHH